MLTKEIQAFVKFPIITDSIPVLLTEVIFYQKDMEEVEVLQNSLSPYWKKTLEQYNTVAELKKYENVLREQLAIVDPFKEIIQVLKKENRFEDCISGANEVKGAYKALINAENKMVQLLQIEFADEGEDWLEGRIQSCDKILSNTMYLKEWIVYRQFAKECKECGLGIVCEAYENGLPHGQVIDVYMRSIYKAIVLSVIETEPVLNRFTGTEFNERILQFKKLDEEFLELTKEEMFYILTHNLPSDYKSVTVNKEMNILRRAISSNGRGLSIRALFDQIPTILTMLCPCMLMSPISVAQYLAPENDLFDIVIFDEASQLPTCKAVGVLARGKNAVIVGDPNQMPPTNFFAGNSVDEDNLDIEDLDSILDDCLALGMPQAHLRWHYRSRHESLIAFSNHEFYESSMLTFPSVNDREKRIQLKLVEGYFDRGKGRVNEGEANAIVKEILRRFGDEKLKNQSIGVVTFNISQQILIEDLLQAEFQKSAEFDQWANAGEEPLFVKNLENVQGDERDVILFSIAFGMDAEGKLSMNFGPINKEGGWKRLNVAVTRARSEMMVFSIMTEDMIDLKRTRSKGVESLKNFLEYAQKGRISGEYNQNRKKKNQGILECICKEVSDAGYVYVKDVGRSDFKIDIAVQNPYNPDDYLLGILLDGDSYKQSKNTKDREVAQKNVLQGLGWKLHRIWTMDWWDNREKEIAKLIILLDELRQEAKEKMPVIEEIELADEKIEYEHTRSENDIVNGIDIPDTVTELDQIDEVTEDNAHGEEMFGEESSEKILTDDILNVAVMEQKLSNQVFEKSAKPIYVATNYRSASVPITPMDADTYLMKESAKQIEEKMLFILQEEAPIAEERLIKKTLRSFGLNRARSQVTEATLKLLKKLTYKSYKQNGVKFYWNPNELPDLYMNYRIDVDVEDKRTMEEISQQEMKNAICITLQNKGPLNKDELIKETIRTMGYARSGKALIEAVERGLKYGRKTGEVLLDEAKRFTV